MLELDLKVSARRTEAEGIVSFELQCAAGSELPDYEAGSHIDVEVQPGIVRQYSLCGVPHDKRTWRIAVLKEPNSRGGSAGMHELIHEGRQIRVSRPKNLFSLVPAPHSLLLAGGIGITPILAMARELVQSGKSFEMHYCARSTARTAFRGEIVEGALAPHTRFYASDGSSEQHFDAQRVLSAVPGGTHLYVCGPAGFIDHVLDAARELGWAEDRLHREHFAAAHVDTSGDQPFEVRIASSGVTLRVPSDRSVLDVLQKNGIDVPFSCESGICGTCATRVLQGTPDHRDNYMTDAEHAANDQFTPCCSRAKTALLVLDL